MRELPVQDCTSCGMGPPMPLASRLIMIACLGHCVAYLYAAPRHVIDASWPLHAQFHVLQAIFWIIALNIVLAMIGWRPFARGEAWAFWALLLGGLGSQGGYFAAMVALPAGRPPALSSHLALGVILVVYGVGLVLGRPRRSRAASR